MKQGNRYKEKCCGNCHWFDNEDAYGVGWCNNNDHESSCDQAREAGSTPVSRSKNKVLEIRLLYDF